MNARVESRNWLAVALVGTGLWLFLTVTQQTLSLIPQLADASQLWDRRIAFAFPNAVDLLLAVLLTALLFLGQRLARARNARGAIGVALIPALVAGFASVAEGEKAGLLGIGAARALLLAAGLMLASAVVHRLTRTTIT